MKAFLKLDGHYIDIDSVTAILDQPYGANGAARTGIIVGGQVVGLPDLSADEAFDALQAAKLEFDELAAAYPGVEGYL